MIILNSYFNADHQNGKIYHVTFEKMINIMSVQQQEF